MGWLIRRGMSWKDQTLESLSPPPTPLMVFFGLLMTLVYFATYSDHKERVERRKTGFRFSLLLLPLVAIVAVNMMMLRRRMLRYSFGVLPPRASVYRAVMDDGGAPSGLWLLLLMLLILVYYQSWFASSWFRVF